MFLANSVILFRKRFTKFPFDTVQRQKFCAEHAARCGISHELRRTTTAANGVSCPPPNPTKRDESPAQQNQKNRKTSNFDVALGHAALVHDLK